MKRSISFNCPLLTRWCVSHYHHDSSCETLVLVHCKVATELFQSKWLHEFLVEQVPKFLTYQLGHAPCTHQRSIGPLPKRSETVQFHAIKAKTKAVLAVFIANIAFWVLWLFSCAFIVFIAFGLSFILNQLQLSLSLSTWALPELKWTQSFD